MCKPPPPSPKVQGRDRHTATFHHRQYRRRKKKYYEQQLPFPSCRCVRELSVASEFGEHVTTAERKRERESECVKMLPRREARLMNVRGLHTHLGQIAERTRVSVWW